jgi:hypothetical protein
MYSGLSSETVYSGGASAPLLDSCVVVPGALCLAEPWRVSDASAETVPGAAVACWPCDYGWPCNWPAVWRYGLVAYWPNWLARKRYLLNATSAAIFSFCSRRLKSL